MKTILLAVLVASSLYAQSQTKGTNAIGFGLAHQTQKISGDNPAYSSKYELQTYNLSYSHFVKDNSRVGLTGDYHYGKNSYNSTTSSTVKGYGGSVHYQHYYP